MTNDMEVLGNPVAYGGASIVIVGNGHSLLIANIGDLKTVGKPTLPTTPNNNIML